MSAPTIGPPPATTSPGEPALEVAVRPVEPSEAGHVVDTVFAGLSPRSRLMRFHAPVPRLPANVRAALVAVDGRRHAAVVALTPDTDGRPTPVGVARVIGPGHGRADLALAVVDAWQRCGLGRRLLAAVSAVAEEIGYTELRGSVLPDNAAMLALARRLHPGVRPRWDGAAVELLVPVGAAAVTITDEDVMADLLSR